MFIAPGNNPFDGFFSYLYMTNPDNFAQTVIPTGERYTDEWGEPDVIFNPIIDGTSKSQNWASKSDSNASVFVRLVNFSILLTNYTFKTRTDDNNLIFPRGWELYGSQDSYEWYLLHSIDNTDDLMGTGRFKQYECRRVNYF